MPVSKRQNDAANQARYAFVCRACGNAVESGDAGGGICGFCALFSHTTPADLEKEPEIRQLLADLHASLQSKAWEEAVKTADAMAAKNTPDLLYGAGVAYFAYSDAEYSNTEYNLHGYMEENSDHRENGVHLSYKARQYLEGAIWACKNDTNSATDERTSYMKFMASMKLGKLEDMQTYLSEINAKGTDTIMMKYANMAYYSYSNDLLRSNKLAESLIGSGIVTALYYIARNMVRKRKYKAAKKTLEGLLSSEEMPEARKLLEYVNATLSS